MLQHSKDWTNPSLRYDNQEKLAFIEYAKEMHQLGINKRVQELCKVTEVPPGL
jgi:hypothetical protein